MTVRGMWHSNCRKYGTMSRKKFTIAPFFWGDFLPFSGHTAHMPLFSRISPEMYFVINRILFRYVCHKAVL